MTPEATAIAEAQAAKDRVILVALRRRDARLVADNRAKRRILDEVRADMRVNLAIRPKSKKRRR